VELDRGICTIRSWRASDRDSLARHANDREIWINLRDRFPHPYTPADADAWLALAPELRPETNFAIAVDGEAVGGIGLALQEDVHRRSAEIGYWLGREYWGRGIATEALRATTEWGFAHLDLCRIYAAVFAWNPASARVLEKAGYALEGRLRRNVTKAGRTTDQWLYAITRESPESAENAGEGTAPSAPGAHDPTA
jgi:[ribosomal protein S5]-alanine N-acetyltransferase